MTVLVVTPPASLVSLEEAKAHLRVTTDDEDALITGYLESASAWIDGPAGWLGRSIGEQVLEYRTDAFPCDYLPYGPVQSITSVAYVDADGEDTVVPAETYRLAADRLLLAHGAGWPSVRGDTEGVRVRYVAGEAAVPPQVRQAILLLVGQWFRNRMSVVVGTINSELPFGVDSLLKPLRRFR